MNFHQSFGKVLKFQMFTKFVKWEQSCLMPTEGRTDGRTAVTNLIFTFSKSAKHLIYFGLLYVYSILNHVLTFVCPMTALLENEVTVVVNRYDAEYTTPQSCKCDILESYYEEEFVRTRIFEFIYVKQSGIPYCLPTI